MRKKEELVDAVLESAYSTQESGDRKRLTCTDAFKLAGRFDVKVIEIGRLCNQHNIKICKCQLGCFK